MNLQPRLTLFVCAWLILTSALANGQDSKKGKESPKQSGEPNYYPLQVGNKWIYRSEFGKTTVTIAKTETIDGAALARAEFAIDGKVVFTEHLRQTVKGIFRHRNNSQEFNPPLKLLQYPVKAGDKWSGDITAGKESFKYLGECAEETLTVVAGEFKTMRVTIKVDAEENGVKKAVSSTYWFAQDVGFVKLIVKTENLNINMELEKFEPAKVQKKAK